MMLPVVTKPTYEDKHPCRLLDGFADLSASECEQLECVSGLTLDSREVVTGDLFFACESVTGNSKAANNHGIAYAGAAVKAGASLIAWEPTKQLSEMPASCEYDGKAVPLIAIPGLRQHVGKIAARFYDEPSKKINVVGITGTNGKSSVSHFLAQALSDDKEKAAVIGTLGNGLWDQLESASHTTPDAINLQKKLAEFVADGVKNVAMEVSSHALEQGRVNGVNFTTALFTNLSRDHLDYHGDMKSYAAAKEKLFKMPKLGTAIVNVDDSFGKTLQEKYQDKLPLVTYSTKGDADVYAAHIEYLDSGIKFELYIGDEKASVTVPVYAAFNVSNLVATASVLSSEGVSAKNIAKRLSQLKPVIGRMQKIDTTEAVNVFIDYAHTPDGLEHALKGLRQHFDQPIICVFGCGGDRDQGKRSMMGKIA